MYTLFELLFLVMATIGLVVVITCGYWLARFRPAAKEVGRYAKGFTPTTCPVCGGTLTLNETVKTSLGIPSIARIVACDMCLSRLEGTVPSRWRWHVDTTANDEMAWLYGGETISDTDLGTIAGGGHTPSAHAKLQKREEDRRRAEAERIERERQQARAEALASIASGNLDTLIHLEDQLIEIPSGKAVHRSAAIYTRLDLQKGEQCVVVISPINLGELRTQDNRPIVKILDTGGEFVVTTKRYAFVGPSKTVQQKLSVIEKIEAKGDTLVISRSNRKTPEYFVGVDARLAEAILKGVRGT